MKRARERHLNIEGRNLNADLDAAAPKPPGNARSQAGTPVAGVGCAALADHLPEKYDGTTNLSEFLQVYVTAIIAAGGIDTVMASYFHVALTGPAQTWLMNLTPGMIQSWEELCARFCRRISRVPAAGWRSAPAYSQ